MEDNRMDWKKLGKRLFKTVVPMILRAISVALGMLENFILKEYQI